MATRDDDEEWKSLNPQIDFASITKYGSANVDKVIASLSSGTFLRANPRLKKISQELTSALEEWKKGTPDGLNQYQTLITQLQAKKIPTSRQKLGRYLHDQDCIFDADINLPDLSKLVKSNSANYDADCDRVASRLEKYLDRLDPSAITPTMQNIFTKVIDAYGTKNNTKINALNSLIKTRDDMLAAFDVERQASGYAYPPHFIRRVKLDTFIPAPGPTPAPRPTPPPPVIEMLDGYTSDQWKQLLDGAKTNGQMPVFLEMMADSLRLSEGLEISALKNVLGDKFPKDFDKLSKEDKDSKIQELKGSLNPAKLAAFNIKLTDNATVLAEALPPHQLAAMAKNIDVWLKKQYSPKEATPELKNQLQNLQAQKEILVAAMFSKTVDYVNGDIVVDQDNVADVYDGAIEMFDYLDKLDNLPADTKKAYHDAVVDAKAKLEPEIIKYDQDNGLAGIKEADAETLEKSFDTTWKIAEAIDFGKKEQRDTWFGPVGTWLDALKFEGDDAAKKKETFIETIKLTAARNAAVKNPSADDKTLAEKLKQELDAVGAAYYSSLITTDALAQLPETATKDQRDQAVAAALANPPPVISDKGLIAFQAATVNNHVSWLNRLASKSHLNNRKATVLNKIYGPLQKIDKTCIARFGSNYIAVRSFGQMMLRNMGAQALNQSLRIGCNLGCLAFNTPGIGSQVYAAVYAGMAARRFYKAYKDEKKAAQADGKKFGLGKFLLQKAPEIALTAAGTAASFFGGAVAQHGVEAVVRYGMMGAGWLISFSKGIHASRKQGNGWLKSLGKAFTNASASTAMAVGSGMAMATGINHFSTMLNNVNMDMWGEHGTRQPQASEYNADDASYTKETIDLGDQANAYKEMTPEQLNEAGIIKDTIPQEDAQKLVTITDEKLAEQGIIRSVTAETDPNGVKVIDQEASSTYDLEAKQNAENIVKYWTSANPEVYQSNLANLTHADSPLSRWNAAHPTQAIDPHRLELIIGDSGGQMVARDVDHLTNHVNGDMKNEHAVEVKGNHKVFGAGWLAEHGEKVGVTAQDIAKIAALHGSDGKIDLTKLTPDVLAAIDKIDQIVSPINEVLDTEVTRPHAHTDGFLDRNATPDKDGVHVHSDDKAKIFNTYADGKEAKIVIPEQAHHERFDQFSQVLQHSFIPFTVTFDRMWAKGKDFCLNMIMGSNGKREAAAKPSHVRMTGGRP